MKITDQIHALKIQFKIPVSPEIIVDRYAFVYILFGDKIHLIDSGIKGSESDISAYIESQGRKAEDISTLILTHCHPDHIGSAAVLKKNTGCRVLAHSLEKEWIENTDAQFAARPVPGFHDLVGGPVIVDRTIETGVPLELEKNIILKPIFTPGHSQGSVSFLYKNENALFSGDALAFPGDLPIYEDISVTMASISELKKLENINTLLSSWEDPIQGDDMIRTRMDESQEYLKRIHEQVLKNSIGQKDQDIMELCKKTIAGLGLPPFAANPLVAKAFTSSLTAPETFGLDV